MKFRSVSDCQILHGASVFLNLLSKSAVSILRANPAFISCLLFILALHWTGVFSGTCFGDPHIVPGSAFSETALQTETQVKWDEADVQISAGIIPSPEPGEKPAEIGVWKPGRWTPFRVRIAPKKNTKETFHGWIVLELSDPDGVAVLTEKEVRGKLPLTAELCGSPGNSTTKYTLKIFESRVDPMTDSGKIPPKSASLSSHAPLLIFQTTRPLEGALAETKGTIWVVGPSNAGLEAGVSQIPSIGDLKPKVVRFSSAADLPASQSAWELADVLVLTTEDEAVLASWRPEEIRRLETWTRQGGILVLSIGRNAEKWAADPNWKTFLPGTLEKVVPVRETAAMEVFAQSPIPITLLGVSERFRIPVARFTELRSKIQLRAQQFDLPLVLRDSMELGQIHWVTFDLTHPAFINWEGKGNFISVLLDFPTQSIDTGEKKSRGMESGFDDMAGQMRSALDDFTGIRPVSFGLLALFFFVYLLIIGPGCWFLCRKLPQGGEMASWAAFFMTVSLGCALLHALTGKNNNVRLNQIQVTDYVQETGTVRQSLWANVWSPNANRLTLGLLPTACQSQTQAETRIGWFGLPGNFLGGMNSRISGTSLVLSEETGCRIRGEKMEEVPFFACSTKSFFANRWFQIANEAEKPKFADLRTFYQTRVLGEIRNPFSVPMEHGLLLFDGWAWEIGRIEPGGTFTITETTPYSAASALLLDADFIEDRSIKSSVGIRRKNRPYDRTSRDLEYIMRTMLFYEKCGGFSYTGLHHSFLRNLDASSLLNCRTAILYAAVPAEETVVNTSAEKNLFTSLNVYVPKAAEAQTEDPAQKAAQSRSQKVPVQANHSNSVDRNVRLLRIFLSVSEE